MARKRYTEEQIIGVLQEAEAGTKTSELCCKHGMSEGTFCSRIDLIRGLSIIAAVSPLWAPVRLAFTECGGQARLA